MKIVVKIIFSYTPCLASMHLILAPNYIRYLAKPFENGVGEKMAKLGGHTHKGRKVVNGTKESHERRSSHIIISMFNVLSSNVQLAVIGQEIRSHDLPELCP